MARPKVRRQINSEQVKETVTDPETLYGSMALEPNRAARVTVTVDSGLLNFIDDYVQWHTGTNRSAVFDEALEMWVRWMQAELDKNSSTKRTKKEAKEHSEWSRVTTEAAKHIWP